MKEISLDEVLLTPDAITAWSEMAGQVAMVLQKIGKMRDKTLSIPDERVQVNDDGTLTIFVSIPDVVGVSMTVPVGHWSYRQ